VLHQITADDYRATDMIASYEEQARVGRSHIVQPTSSVIGEDRQSAEDFRGQRLSHPRGLKTCAGRRRNLWLGGEQGGLKLSTTEPVHSAVRQRQGIGGRIFGLELAVDTECAQERASSAHLSDKVTDLASRSRRRSSNANANKAGSPDDALPPQNCGRHPKEQGIGLPAQDKTFPAPAWKFSFIMLRGELLLFVVGRRLGSE
jgi:hypothetical protein